MSSCSRYISISAQDKPVVANVDSVSGQDLYLSASRGSDTLDLSAHPGALQSDGFSLVEGELQGLNANIQAILGIDHPVLAKVAQYFFDARTGGSGGKKVRPAMVLLMSRAVNAHMESKHGLRSAAASAQHGSDSDSGVIDSDRGVHADSSVAVGGGVGKVALDEQDSQVFADILRLQQRLAEITEMIHTASLLHDDVIDNTEQRRGSPSVNSVFGNKLAVLAGDFLLARASVCLARLRSIAVVELLSNVIEQLVKGEVMQMHTAVKNSPDDSSAALLVYLRKTCVFVAAAVVIICDRFTCL